MDNIKKLTSKSIKIKYVIVYTIYSLLYITSPLIVMQFINKVIDKDIKAMIFYAILYFCSFVAIQVTSYIFSMMVGKVESNNFISFYSKLDNKLQNYDLRKKSLEINDLNQQIGQNYEIANPYFYIQPIEYIFSIINIIAIFIIMFFINWKISLILLVIIPLSFLASKHFEKKMYSKAEKNLDDIKNVKEYVTDQYKLSKEERFLDKKQLGGIGLFLNRYKKSQYDNCKTKSTYLYFYTYCFLNFAILIVIVLSGFLTYQEQITIGVLFAFQNYTSQLWQPGEFLMSFRANYQQAKPALEDLNELLNLEEIEYSNERIQEINVIDFEALNKDEKVINEKINFRFELGHTYLICGDNGSGKTTLIEAIMGFNSRYNGKILINGKELMSNDIVYISADAYLSKIYDEDNKKVSSGQKKLAQINLFLKTEKSVYIFDEPTNFIDESKKEFILNLIKELSSKDKMIIIVSHDDKVLNVADKVLKIKKNNIN